MKLTVIKAPPVDRNELRVRINSNDKPGFINWYDYIQVENAGNDKKVVCKLHGDDIPEIEKKQASLIYINEPLRGKLGVGIGDSLNFNIKKRIAWFAWFYFIRYHPNDVVRVSIWLGIVAIILASIAIVISIF